MSWLYGQTWLCYLIAFLIGLLLAWLVFVRPQQRRLKALLARSTAATPSAGVATAQRQGRAPAAGAGGAAGAVASALPQSEPPGVALAGAPAAGARGNRAHDRTDPPTESIPVIDPAGDTPTESIPVVDIAADSPTDVFPAVDPALNTLDTARVTAADAATPPTGTAAVPSADDPPTEERSARARRDEPPADQAPPGDAPP